MITGVEIRNQQFEKSLRGYNVEQVRLFLQHMAQDYETIYSDNSQLKENIQRLNFEVEKYRKIEQNVNNSLIIAQQTAENLMINAQKEAELMLEEARMAVSQVLSSYQEVVKRIYLLNIDLKAQLSVEIDMIDKNISKTDAMTALFNNQDIKKLLENISTIKPEG